MQPFPSMKRLRFTLPSSLLRHASLSDEALLSSSEQGSEDDPSDNFSNKPKRSSLDCEQLSCPQRSHEGNDDGRFSGALSSKSSGFSCSDKVTPSPTFDPAHNGGKKRKRDIGYICINVIIDYYRERAELRSIFLSRVLND